MGAHVFISCSVGDRFSRHSLKTSPENFPKTLHDRRVKIFFFRYGLIRLSIIIPLRNSSIIVAATRLTRIITIMSAL